MAAPPLRLVLTEAGIARFTAAQLGQPIDLSVAKVGLTANVVALAPTLTALPGEFRRLATVSGKQVGRDVAHLIVRDEAATGYTVRGVGLFLADGTLFAVYAQAEPIAVKSILTTLLLALDIAFPANSTTAITFGSTDFLNPPATEDTKGVLELATAAEADAGTPGALAITAAVLKAIVSPIRDAVTAAQNAVALTAASLSALLARTISGDGLVTGGGDLGASRTLTVTAATAAEADAGTLATKALTPASIANVLASIVARVPLVRRVATDGLALGGGALTTDLTISVPAATGPMVRAGGATNAAATPKALADAGAVYVVQQLLQQNGGYRVWSDGLKECWGQIGVPASGGTVSVVLPVAHTAWVAPAGAPGAINQDEQMLGILNVGLSGFDVRNRNPMAATFYWHTRGV